MSYRHRHRESHPMGNFHFTYSILGAIQFQHAYSVRMPHRRLFLWSTSPSVFSAELATGVVCWCRILSEGGPSIDNCGGCRSDGTVAVTTTNTERPKQPYLCGITAIEVFRLPRGKLAGSCLALNQRSSTVKFTHYIDSTGLSTTVALCLL